MKDFKRKLGALCLAMSALTWSLPNVARAEIVKQEVPTVYKSGVDKIADACEGYTQQSCDVVTTNADGSISRTPQTFNCCGKTECQNMLDPNDPTRCKVSRVFAHGSRDTCTEPEQVSPCGMSCCGKEDCASVCNNYRLDVCKGYNQDPNGNKCCGKEDCEKSACGYWTVTTEDMGTPGISCCGYLDCANKACGGYTYIESKVFPDKKLACCGKEDCEKRACGGATQTTGAYGGLSGLACCGDGPNLEGSPNCRLTECQNYIQTTSVSDLAENKKKLECCGPGKIPGNPANKQWGNCWQVHCDNYISTIVEDTKDENGKNGTSVDCCGYLDCLEKQCSGHTSVVPYGKGSEDAIQCCGEKQCEQIYLDSFPDIPTPTCEIRDSKVKYYIGSCSTGQQGCSDEHCPAGIGANGECYGYKKEKRKFCTWQGITDDCDSITTDPSVSEAPCVIPNCTKKLENYTYKFLLNEDPSACTLKYRLVDRSKPERCEYMDLTRLEPFLTCEAKYVNDDCMVYRKKTEKDQYIVGQGWTYKTVEYCESNTPPEIPEDLINKED